MRRWVAVDPSFPLTLPLSLPPSRRAKAPLRRDGGGEREPQPQAECLAHWFGKPHRGYARETAHDSPSPAGRGPGGEQSVAYLSFR